MRSKSFHRTLDQTKEENAVRADDGLTVRGNGSVGSRMLKLLRQLVLFDANTNAFESIDFYASADFLFFSSTKNNDFRGVIFMHPSRRR